MASDEKTFAARLDLREQALTRWMAGEPLKVLDLGAGEGRLWKSLRQKFDVAEYTPVDRKPQMPGTLEATVDLGLLTNLGIHRYNVVDVEIDQPWEVWLSLAMFATHKLLVTMTAPSPKKTPWLDPVRRMILGIPQDWGNVPVNEKLSEHVADRCLRKGLGYAGVTEPVLTFAHPVRVSGYAILCPGRK